MRDYLKANWLDIAFTILLLAFCVFGVFITYTLTGH